MTRAWSLQDVSRLLNVRASRIHYALITRAVEEPRLRIGNRRVFEAADVERLAAHFHVSIDERSPEIAANKHAGETL